MQNVINGLIGLAVLGFLLAVITVLLGPMIMTIQAESFSRACTNLSLIIYLLPKEIKRVIRQKFL